MIICCTTTHQLVGALLHIGVLIVARELLWQPQVIIRTATQLMCGLSKSLVWPPMYSKVVFVIRLEKRALYRLADIISSGSSP